MKKHYETHVEDTDKLISVAGPVLDYKSWYEQYRKLMEEQAQRKHGLYTPTSEGDDDDFPSIPGMIARYSALGLTNEQMTANPVWKDLTGNGHDLQMKNFAYGGMSGVNGYKFDFLLNEWATSNEQISEKYSYKIVINNKQNSVQLINNSRHIKITLKITGIEINKSIFRVYDNAGMEHKQDYTKDGIYEIDYTANEGANKIYFYVVGGNTGQLENPITIEQLPLYPGALVFDGVDDYGVCENFPILNKEKGYTVVALRQWISIDEGPCGLVSNVKHWFEDGAFVLESLYPDSIYTISFGATRGQKDLPHILTYQTSKSYNGVLIATGNFEGTDVLHVGKLALTNVGTCINAAIWELVFLDHDATEEELTKIKDYFVKTYPWLFPDQAWTVVGKTNEDEDRATIANITGNGNDLVLSNFGFAEGSGYGLYAYNFNSFNLRDNVVKPTDVKKDSFRIIGTGNSSNLLILTNESDSANWKIRITGMKDGDHLLVGNANKRDDYVKITKDGVYTFQKQYVATSTNGIWYNSSQEVDVLVEQIPEYEGYLVTDGVDDKAVSKQFKFGENFTVILDFKFPVKKISYCGFDLSSKVRIQNLQGSGVYVVLKGNKTLIPSNVVRAVTSEGKVYDENWNEYNIVPGNISSNYTMVNLGFDGSNQFAESATKLAGIYSSALSKDDCIKAYNYLQTLKAK